MWGAGAGSEVMRRMVGGMVSAPLLPMFVSRSSIARLADPPDVGGADAVLDRARRWKILARPRVGPALRRLLFDQARSLPAALRCWHLNAVGVAPIIALLAKRHPQHCGDRVVIR